MLSMTAGRATAAFDMLSTTEDKTPRGDRHLTFVQSLERGLAVIRALGGPEPGITLTGLADKTGLTRATARRYLLTLEELEYVRSDGRRFHLTPRVLDLGYPFLSAVSLRDIAALHLRVLTERLHLSSSLVVLDGSEIVFVVSESGRGAITVAPFPGTRLPAGTTAMGRILLSGLGEAHLRQFLEGMRRASGNGELDVQLLRREIAQIRTRGWAVVEHEEATRSLAVPVRSSGTIVAGIGVMTPASEATPEQSVEELLAPVIETAALIESDLAAVPRGAVER
jgi:IclR family transcriptional regulator, pca regulon regulatory protein